MKKPELLTPVGDLNELERLLDAGADAVVVGADGYGLRVPGTFSIEEIERAVVATRQRGKKIYVAMNALLHNERLDGLESRLKRLSKLEVDAIEYADPAVLMTAKTAAPNVPLHWNPEMIATSFHTLRYWQSKGVERAWLARELNLDEMIETKEQSEMEIGVQVHGLSCIFYSKRPLVHSYFDYLSLDAAKEGKDQKRGLYLKEEKREDISYPIFEDESGTHIMSGEDICLIEYLDELIDAEIDSFRIETLLKPLEYNEVVVKAYRRAIDLYTSDEDAYDEEVESLLASIEAMQDPKRPLTTGFLFKELVF